MKWDILNEKTTSIAGCRGRNKIQSYIKRGSSSLAFRNDYLRVMMSGPRASLQLTSRKSQEAVAGQS